MIIESLQIRQFGRFENFSATFAPGLNLISGPNEAGKSTLMAAIPAILFGVRDKERWRTWGDSGKGEGTLVLRDREKRVRICREWSSDRVTLSEEGLDGRKIAAFDGKVAPLGRSSEKILYLDHLQRLFGQADEELFHASLFFSQGSDGFDTPAELAARIKAILSGCAELDYDDVLGRLMADYFTVTRENPWGKDKSKDRELERVRKRLAELERLWYAGRNQAGEQEAAKGRIAALNDEIAVLRSRLDAAGERSVAEQKQARLQDREESLRRDFSRVQRASGQAGGLRGELQQLEQELAHTGLPAEIPAALPQHLGAAEALRRDMIKLQEEANRLRREQGKIAQPPWRGAVALSLVLFALTALFGRDSWPLLAVGGGLNLILWGLFTRRLLSLNRERASFDTALATVAASRAALQSDLAGIEEELRRLGLPASAVEMVKMEKGLEKHRRLVTRISEIRAALGVLEPERLAGEEAELTRELAVIAERRETLAPAPAEASDSQEELRETLRRLESELIEQTRIEAALAARLPDPRRIEEEGEALSEKEAQLELRRDALALGCNLLRSAIDDFRGSYLDDFAAEAGRTLSVVTRQRYLGLRLDDAFNPFVSMADSVWRDAGHLSRGARDGLAFAVRLALARYLTRGRTLPLFLDDPFVHLDRQRHQALLKILEEAAHEHQILYFSHSDTLQKRAEKDGWQILDLDTNAAPPVAAPAKAREKQTDDSNQLSFL